MSLGFEGGIGGRGMCEKIAVNGNIVSQMNTTQYTTWRKPRAAVIFFTPYFVVHVLD